MSKGVDYSFARPGGAAVKAGGFSFAMRYLSDYPSKNISAAEANDLRANGIAIGLVFENAATDALGGHDAGVANGQKAAAQAEAIGFPHGLPIYAAVDFDITDAQKPTMGAYLRGFAEGLGGKYKVGIYGGFYALKYAAENNEAEYYWQTLAWSGGQVHPSTNIYQNGQTALGGTADVNEGRKDDIGVWGSNVGSVPSQPAPAPAASGQTYTVQPRDTLSGIAAKYGTTYQALAALNNIPDPNKINVGQVIKISGSASPTTQANGQTYTVKPNDNLTNIAAKYGTSVSAIASANGIADPNKIYVGQTLRIPGTGVSNPAPGALTYVVQPNDTLGAIATKYHTTYQHLAQINGIPDPNKIYAGQTIKIA